VEVIGICKENAVMARGFCNPWPEVTLMDRRRINEGHGLASASCGSGGAGAAGDIVHPAMLHAFPELAEARAGRCCMPFACEVGHAEA